MPRWFSGAAVLALSALVATLWAGASLAQGGEPQPIDGLDSEELARFEAGRDVFVSVHGPGEGLGPVFNGRACAECHAAPGPGGSSADEKHQVLLFGRTDFNGGFDPLTQYGGPVRSQLSLRRELPGCGLAPETAPKEANVKSHRQPSPLYGLGLLEAIPDEVILAQIEIGAAADPGEVRGRANVVDGRVGRFGWKAQSATLEQFVGQALNDELGITNPLAPDEVTSWRGSMPEACDALPDPDDDGARLAALVDFITMLAPQPRVADSDAIRYGEAVFHQVGCAVCHTPSLPSGSNPIAALSEREVPLYSDLLIHDLGEYLGDDVVQGEAGSTDWRTTPLWGLGRKNLFLHDGRTSDLRQVIDLHTGEARATRYRLRQRPKSDTDSLIEFLRSL